MTLSTGATRRAREGIGWCAIGVHLTVSVLDFAVAFSVVHLARRRLRLLRCRVGQRVAARPDADIRATLRAGARRRG